MLVITLCRVRDGCWLGRRSKIMKYQLQLKDVNNEWYTVLDADSYSECCNWWEVYKTDYEGYAARIIGIVVISVVNP